MSGEFFSFLMHHKWFIRVECLLAVTTILSTTIYLHRHLSHGAVKLVKSLALVFQGFLAFILGANAREWYAGHVIHHGKADTLSDPHTPWSFRLRWVGFLWVLVGALFAHKRARIDHPELFARLVDSCEVTVVDKAVACIRIPKTKYTLNSFGFLGLVTFSLIGWCVGYPYHGILLWLINALVCLLFFGLVNCLGHWRNSLNAQGNHATNLNWVGQLFLFGEGKHEDHHAHPRRAFHGFCDVTGWVIKLFVWCGLATLPDPSHQEI